MMRAQRILAAVAAVAFVAPACNRSDTDENARRAAAEMRDAAARASDQLADSWLTTKIQAQYFADEDVKARFINVSADDGVVTLKGRVDNEAAREQAVQIAKNTDGVRQVTDQLAVGPPQSADAGHGPLDANWITTQIQARFFADSVIDGRDIDVSTNNGVVTLSGRVASETEKQQAVNLARGVNGVARVEDRLTVQELPSSGAVATSGLATSTPAIPAPSDDSRVTTSIQARFFLDNMLKNRRIDVATQQGIVTLTGEVASDNERAQALLLARTTEGADRVEDNLTVNASLAQTPAAGTAQAPAAQANPAAQSEDAALTKSIESKLSGDAQLKSASVSVTVKDGVVLVEGTVPNAAAKQRVLSLARGTKGVVQVVDRIQVARAR